MQLRRRSTSHLKRKLSIACAILFMILGGGWYLLNANFRPALENIAATRVDAIASDAMYQAVLDHLSSDEEYNELVEIRSTDQKVIYARTDSQKLNLLAAVCAQEAQEHLDLAGEQGVEIPIGTLTGVPLLAGHGPHLRVTFYPENNINGEIHSEFRSAGINQTLHRISIRLVAYIAVVLPGNSFTVIADAEIPIAENIIVGAVPETYANVGENHDLLNLVP